MSKLLLRIGDRISKFLFGELPYTSDDAMEAARQCRESIVAVMVAIELRERKRAFSALPLKELSADLARGMSDVELYIRTAHWGMAVAVAQRIESEFIRFGELMEQYSGSATVAELMLRYLNGQGPVYPPRVRPFQSWMREHLLPMADPRRRKLALR
jgi:hypothetical protein